MLYKYISKTEIQVQPKYLEKNGNIISNPTEAMLRELGYKDLVETDYPETDENSYRAELYTDGDVIKQSWSEPILFAEDKPIESEGE